MPRREASGTRRAKLCDKKGKKAVTLFHPCCSPWRQHQALPARGHQLLLTPAPGVSVRGVPVTSCTSVQRATSPAPPCDPEFGKIHTLSEELRSKVYMCILEGVRFSCQFSAEEKQQNGAKSKNPDALTVIVSHRVPRG